MANNTVSANPISYNQWYMDSRATYHFTPNLAMMQSIRPFTGGDQVIMENGKKLSISQIGHASIPVSPHSLSINNIFHTSSLSTNVISVSKLYQDNPIFVKFHATHFLVKNQITHHVLLEGLFDHDLYRMQSSSPFSFPPLEIFLTQSSDSKI